MKERLIRGLCAGCALILVLGLAGCWSDYAQPSDEELAYVITQGLRVLEGGVADRIQVKVSAGQVTLSGLVDTVVEKVRAEGLVANTIRGVRSVVNSITVRPAVMQDDSIKKAVQAKLETTFALRRNFITVDVRNGLVELKGMVDFTWQRRSAEAAAKLVNGVRAVINLVTVSPSRPDPDIAKDVALYLLWSPSVDIDRIDVKVAKGVVTLKGAADHLRNVVSMVEDLQKIAGVVVVDFSAMRADPRKYKAS